MLISPKHAIEQGWIVHPTLNAEDFAQSKYVQPNAIDFTLNDVWVFEDELQGMWLSESSKTMRKMKRLPPVHYGSLGEHFEIPSNSVVDFSSVMRVNVPEQVACLLIIRSTLNRNGIFLTSGLYDTKFEGPIAGTLHNRGPVARIATNTRIGQIMFVSSESVSHYSGGYNVPEGQHWTEQR